MCFVELMTSSLAKMPAGYFACLTGAHMSLSCFQIHLNHPTVPVQPNSDHLLRPMTAFTLPIFHANCAYVKAPLDMRSCHMFDCLS